MSKGDCWAGVRDGLELALTEARLEHSHGRAVCRLKDLVDMAEQQKLRVLRRLLNEIGRGP